MNKNDLRVLISTHDRTVAENIQFMLEESGIYSLLVSDNPASSILTTYTGLNPIENIEVQITGNDYDIAVEILMDSTYRELFIK